MKWRLDQPLDDPVRVFLSFTKHEGMSLIYKIESFLLFKKKKNLGGDSVVKTWDQEVCSLCGLRFEPCGCSYDGHWRLTWSLISGPVGLVEVRAS
jgi:hypothetical protein